MILRVCEVRELFILTLRLSKYFFICDGLIRILTPYNLGTFEEPCRGELCGVVFVEYSDGRGGRS